MHGGIVMLEQDLRLLVLVKANCNATANTFILHSVLTTLWLLYERGPYLGVMVRCPKTFLHIVYINYIISILQYHIFCTHR